MPCFPRSLYHSDRLSRALVQALSAFICAVLVPILGSMSLVITKWEKLKVSQAAMLKQVKGLQAEYDRVTSSKAPGAYGKGGSAEGAEEERLRARVNQLRAELDSLKVHQHLGPLAPATIEPTAQKPLPSLKAFAFACVDGDAGAGQVG